MRLRWSIGVLLECREQCLRDWDLEFGVVRTFTIRVLMGCMVTAFCRGNPTWALDSILGNPMWALDSVFKRIGIVG